jgi:hypothetical protein
MAAVIAVAMIPTVVSAIIMMIAMIPSVMTAVVMMIAVIATTPMIAVPVFAAVTYNYLAMMAPVTGISFPDNSSISPWLRLVKHYLIAVVYIKISVAAW